MKRIKLLMVLIGSILMGGDVLSQQRYEEYTNLLNGVTKPFAVGDEVMVSDTLMITPTAKAPVIATNEIINILTLSFQEPYLLKTPALPDTFTVQVGANIFVQQAPESAEVQTTKTFTLTYSRRFPYKKSDVFYFSNGRKVRVEITSITTTGIADNVVKGLLLLNNDMRINRDYDINCASCGLTGFGNTYPSSLTDAVDEVNVSWALHKAAEMYDLEWVYIDKVAHDDGRYGTPGTLDFANRIFRFNATRVTVPGLSYKIPMLFNGAGYVYFRYRAVQELQSGERVTTQWSYQYNLTAGLGEISFNGHSNEHNWQSATSFAEEGKRKSVLQYFDGSLKERQSVTKDNTRNTTVVGSTLYDHQGKAVVNVLPAPTVNSLIKYTPLLNRDINSPGSEYGKTLYDGLAQTGEDCCLLAPGMDTSSGASKYYSAANPNKTTAENQFIPDARKYPFSQTKYSQDNTGRLIAQGGVGVDFGLGSGHETKYYYGVPSQMDLDALFGTDAGDASHYQKNMVRDANGQYSVSYVDMKGKTVATALAGDSPANMTALNSNVATMRTESLLAPSNNLVTDNSISFTKSIVVPVTATYYFTYSLNSQTLQLPNWEGQTICYDCLYDLEIRITSDCNTKGLPNETEFVFRKSNFSLESINSNCSDPNRAYTDTFQVELKEGSYNISKVLTISQVGKNYYRENVYLPNNNKTTFEDIYATQANITQQNLGNCEQIAMPSEEADYYRDVMYGQMKPGGIYHDRIKNPSIDFGNIDEVIKDHPEHSVYLRYKELKASNDWDAAMLKLETFDEAVQQGFLNPLQFTTSPANKFPATNPDPFFIAGSTYYNTMKASLQNAMITQLSPEKYADLWMLANMMVKCGVVNNVIDPACVAKFSNPANVFNDFLLCPSELDEAWTIFKSVYQAKKKSVTSKYLFAGSYPVVRDEDRLFIDPEKLWTKENLHGVDPNEKDPNVLIAQGAEALAASIDKNCKEYAQYWWNKLVDAGCGFEKLRDSAIIIDRLIAVCKEGGDATHVFGASTVKPGSTHPFKSFTEAIVDYVTNTPVLNQDITLCNGLLIDAPAPYDKPVMSGGKPITDKPDECECKNIRGLNKVYQDTYAGKYSSMSVFLKQVYKTDITQGAIDSLLRLCNNEIVCTRIPQPIVLPPVLQCGFVQNACVDCQKVADAHAAFLAAFPSVTPSKEDDLQKNKFYAHVMYEKTGVRFTATEYLNFVETCNATPGSFAGSMEVADGVTGGNCIKDTLAFPSTGVAKPEWITCADLVRNYQNFLAEFPNRTKGAKVRMFVEDIINTFNKVDTTSQSGLVRSSSNPVTVPLRIPPAEEEGSLAINNLSGPNMGEERYTVSTDTVPVSKKSLMQAMVELPLPGRWVDTTLTAKQLFEWYMSQHLGLAGYPYTAENYADWLINGCGVKMNQLPWSSEVYVRKDTLQNIWNRFAAKYSVGQLNITETVQVPIVKGQQLSTNDPVAYFADERLSTIVWTDGDFFKTRSTNVFKVSTLPKNATISNATLNMYALKDSWISAAHFRQTTRFPFVQATQLNGIWISGTTTFETQPSTYAGAPALGFPYTTIRKSVGSSTDFWSDQDYLTQNVTPLLAGVYHSLDSSGVNYPIQYKINSDDIEEYKRQVFHGISAPNGKSLSLSVSYTASRCDVFAAFVNNALDTYLSLDEIKELYASKGELLINSNCTGTTATSGCAGDTIRSAPVKVYRSDLLLCGSAVEATFPPLPISVLPNACKDSSSMTWLVTQEIYNYQQSLLLGNFEKAYTDKCLAAASFESLVMTSPVSEYHYTLYYYDQAGNLVQTVPPAGVRPNREVTWLNQVAEKRALGQEQTPLHVMVTKYRYNSLNQVISQHSPDGGQSNFWYDRLGRLAVSRNAEQKNNNQYSYTLYDVLGRIREVGQKQQLAGLTDAVSRDPNQLMAWLNYQNGTYPHQQVTMTAYDKPATGAGGYDLFQPRTYTGRNRVSSTRFINQLTYDGTENGYPKPDYDVYDYASYFGYDVHGNVEVLLNDYRTGAMAAHGFNRFKMINYGYDLISGKVNYVAYQSSKLDELYHRYSYDAENRLTEVFTTHRKPFVGNRNVEEREAAYNYYTHGPLARLELGANKVQAVDYAYTLQGWLKGVNSTALNPVFDMGADGKDVNSVAGRDVFGFSLSYFMGDYKPINVTVTPFAEAGAYLGASDYKALFNGNIAYMSTSIKGLNTQLYNYRYDQLNRLVKMDAHKGFDHVGNSWSGQQPAGIFGESITYDPNGNIVSYNRDGNKVASPAMDRMEYNYVSNSNKLDYIKDDLVGAGAYLADIDGQSPGNYGYDAIGNLTRDNSEGITGIEWTVYGKIKRVIKADKTIEYAYDASGNRISKTVDGMTTWYVRDAQGNTLTTYEINAADIRAKEAYLYGSSRIGSFDRNLLLNSSLNLTPAVIAGIGNTYSDNQNRGQRQYELSNHLGNVLATIGDKKIWNSTLNAFEADVQGASDYYPFGMLMPERNYGQPENIAGMEYSNTTEVNGHVIPTELSLSSRQGIEPAEYVASNTVELQNGFESGATDEFEVYIADATYAGTGNQVGGAGLSATSGKYRFGFNGKENDNEIKGTGNQQDYGMRIYDTRIGKFLSVDPLTKLFPWYTPYQFAGNNPVQYIDLDGEEPTKKDINYGKNIMVGRVNHNTLTNAYLKSPKTPTPYARDNKNWISFPSSTSDFKGAASALTDFKKENPKISINNIVLSAHGGRTTVTNQSALFYSGDELNGEKVIFAQTITLFKQNSSEITESQKAAIEDLGIIVNSLGDAGVLIIKGCRGDEELARAIQSLATEGKTVKVYFTPDKTETSDALDTRLIPEGEVTYSADKRININRVNNEYKEGFSVIEPGSQESKKLNSNIILGSQGKAVQLVPPVKKSKK